MAVDTDSDSSRAGLQLSVSAVYQNRAEQSSLTNQNTAHSEALKKAAG